MRKIILPLLALLLVTTAPVLAQEQLGKIVGRVQTEDGLAVAGAKVVLSSDSLVAGSIETTTDDGGRFRFQLLPVGDYTIKVTADQYQGWERAASYCASARR